MGLFKKGTKAYGIFNMKCPRCNEGDLFDTPTFSFKKPFDMPKCCPVCTQKYEPEPGFYFGAMFISYIIYGWFCIGFIALLHWVLDWSIAASFAALITLSVFLFVWLFRFSRAIWLNLMVKYDPSQARKSRG